MKTRFYPLFGLFILLSCGKESLKLERNGLDSLIKTSVEASGEHCANGGIKVQVGNDSNANGTLDPEEVTSTNYVCNGLNGYSTLIDVIQEAPGSTCSNGGVKVRSGLDLNNDSILNADEIQSVFTICNGNDGDNSLIKTSIENPGGNCETGGIKIETGIDTNENNTLDENEIENVKYICNGNDGNISLYNIKQANLENCPAGGYLIEAGIDTNSNGILDAEEINNSFNICNGLNPDLPSNSNLLAYYPFNNSPNDESGNENHGNYVGQISSDRNNTQNSALTLNGNGNYFEFPSVVSLNQPSWSFSLWFSLDQLPREKDDAFLLTSKSISYGDDVHLFVDNDDNQIKFFTNDGYLKESTGITVERNKWYHVVLAYDENSIKIYVNGTIRLVWSNTRYSSSVGSSLVVSSIFPGSALKGRIFGKIDDIRVYDIPMTEVEVNALYELEN